MKRKKSCTCLSSLKRKAVFLEFIDLRNSVKCDLVVFFITLHRHDLRLERFVVQNGFGLPVELFYPEIMPVKSDEKHYQIAFNAIPQIDKFQENGFTFEEMKMINETKKIMHMPELQVSAPAPDTA